MSISKILYQTLCVFSQIKDRKHIEQNFHSVGKVMPRGGTAVCGGVKNFSMGICDGAPWTAHSSIDKFCPSIQLCCRNPDLCILPNELTAYL